MSIDSRETVEIKSAGLGAWVGRHPFALFALLIALGGGVWLFYEPFDLEARDERGRTPLIQAAEAGDTATVRELLAQGAKVNARDECRWTALMRAAHHGHAEIVEALLAAGANLHVRDKAGYSLLMVTAANNHAALLRRLAQAGAPLDKQDDDMGWTALIWAVKEGHRESVAALLEAGADANIRDFSGRSAKDWAAQGNSIPSLPSPEAVKEPHTTP